MANKDGAPVHLWDKVFSKSENVNHSKITFYNRYGNTLIADRYEPKTVVGKLPAIAVAGPFGAVKEQVSGLYAQTMAEKGFLTIAFDPSYTGESGGLPRDVASPDINTEDFCAAIDYLSTLEIVNKDCIGIIGICGWGGMALNAAAMDTRIKATVTLSMYDMSRVYANRYFDSMDSDEKYEMLKRLNDQRTLDFKNESYAKDLSVANVGHQEAAVDMDCNADFYKKKRGYHKRSLNSNEGWNITSSLSFVNMPLLMYSSEIRSPVLMIHGDNTHSLYFSKDAFNALRGDNKEIMIIPGINDEDLFDKIHSIPFTKIEQFFNEYLKY